MAQENQEVLDMIAQLRARLIDLEKAVLAFDGDLPGFAQKLDRIDDRVYLLEAEIDKRAAAASASETATEEGKAGDTADSPAAASGRASSAASSKSDGDDNGMNILTPEAKEKIGEAVGDMREIGREAAETFSSLNEAFADITEPFKIFGKPGRRR